MLRNYINTTISSGFATDYITFDYHMTTTTTNYNYFDRIDSGNYTGGTGGTSSYFNDYINQISFEIQPISQPVSPLPLSRYSIPNPEEIYAQEKARKLLLEYLDHDNKQKYLEEKPIEISSKLFNDIIYQIPLSKFGKIIVLKEGKIVSRLCLVVKEPEQIPLEDVVLTKFLYFLNDEEFVLRTANHFGIHENLLARLSH